MAVDTTAKRQSAMYVPFGGVPLPDAAITQPDRKTLLGVYGGIDTPLPPVGTGYRFRNMDGSDNSGTGGLFHFLG